MTEQTEITKREQTPSERFTQAVTRQYAGEVGRVDMTENERMLLQHLFVKCDAAFSEANSKMSDGKTPITWQSVNMRKLAIDAVNRIKLGIDGLVPGHLYPIAYFNSKTKQYDIDLRIGYKGEAYYIMNASLKPIKDIRVELVYANDQFIVYKKGVHCEIEGYDLNVKDPFDRGDVVGGFAYIEYADQQGNTLVTMSRQKIDKSKAAAMSSKFWDAYYEEMAYKTLVHKAVKSITIDPRKINVEALSCVEAEPVPEESALPADANSVDLLMDVSDLDKLTATPVQATIDGVEESAVKQPVKSRKEPF